MLGAVGSAKGPWQVCPARPVSQLPRVTILMSARGRGLQGSSCKVPGIARLLGPHLVRGSRGHVLRTVGGAVVGPGALLHLPPPGGGQRLLAGSRPPGPALPPLPRLLPVPFGALRFAKARRLLVANVVSKSTLYPFSHSKCFTLFCIFPLIEYSGDISLCKRLPYHILNGNIFF